MYSKVDQLADDIREQARVMLETLKHNASVASWHGNDLVGCQCASYENHAGRCLGPDCTCH